VNVTFITLNLWCIDFSDFTLSIHNRIHGAILCLYIYLFYCSIH